MSIMSVQIQCKSSLSQGLTDKLKGLNPMEGGKNGPAESFPTPLLRRNMQLAKRLKQDQIGTSCVTFGQK